MIEWYYRDTESCAVGPLTTSEFHVCVAVGEVLPDTAVWRSGLPTWVSYADLVAEEESGKVACQSRRNGHAPLSSSYRTLIALGASPVHCRPARARVTTSGCTPHGIAEPERPQPQTESAPLADRKTDPLLDRMGTDEMWLGRQFMRMALAGAAFVLVQFFCAQKTAPPRVQTSPAVAAPTVVLGPLRATLGANFAATLSPATQLALPAENGR